jgi:hypothetical protein
MNNLTLVDPDKVRFVREKLKANQADVERIIGAETFATIAGYIPTTPGSVVPISLGTYQGEFIGTKVLPNFNIGALETGYYPKFRNEAFFVDDDKIAIGASAKRTDMGVDWDTVTVDVHGWETALDPRVDRAAASQGINLGLQQADLIKARVALGEESHLNGILTATGSYASGHYQTLTSTALWSDYTASDPITEIILERELVRTKTRKAADTFWASRPVWVKLMFHPKITALVQYGAGKSNPAAPISSDVLAAILGMNILIADAGVSATNGADPGDMYGKKAGLAIVGDTSNQVQPRFGINAKSTSYPKVTQWFDPSAGAEGSNVVKYADAYKGKVCKNTAGYLWAAAIA